MDNKLGTIPAVHAVSGADNPKRASRSSFRRGLIGIVSLGCLVMVALAAASGAESLWIALTIAVAAGTVLVMWEFSTRAILEPLARAGAQMEIVASGESLLRIEDCGEPTVDALVGSFNKLASRVLSDRSTIVELNRTLDNLNGVELRSHEIEEHYSNSLALSEIGRRITSSLSLNDILATTYESINAMMDASLFGLGIVDAENAVLRFSLAIDRGCRMPEYSVTLDDPSSLAAWCARNRRDVFLNDIAKNHMRYVSEVRVLDGEHAPRSAIFSPMSIGDRLIGVISVQSYRTDTYAEHDLDMIRSLAAYTAVAHDHAYAYQQLDHAHHELKEAQSHLVQSEKMASLGQLTAGIAHEINNPINFVSANVKPLQRDIGYLLRLLAAYQELKPGDQDAVGRADIQKLRQEIDVEYLIEEIGDLLKGIEDGASRTAEIVRGLRTFSRVDESELKRSDIREGIDSTLVLLHSTYKGRIEVVKDYEDVPDIECYPGQLNQVFMNLLNNAIQAIPDRGTITISVKRKGQSVDVRISDTGTGIPDDIRERVFDPFFTTKDVGKGTGLGLSISIGIIQNHNGTITLESESKKGTTFHITLPIEQKFN